MVSSDCSPCSEESFALIDFLVCAPAGEALQGIPWILLPPGEGVAIHFQEPGCFSLIVQPFWVYVRAVADHIRVMESVLSV